jgi:hypothetical protein
MDMVSISWFDAFDLPPQWASLEDLQKEEPAIVHSVGWLVEPEPLEGYVTLATSVVDNNYGSGIHIPKVCIIDIVKLRKKGSKNET